MVTLYKSPLSWKTSKRVKPGSNAGRVFERVSKTGVGRLTVTKTTRAKRAKVLLKPVVAVEWPLIVYVKKIHTTKHTILQVWCDPNAVSVALCYALTGQVFRRQTVLQPEISLKCRLSRYLGGKNRDFCWKTHKGKDTSYKSCLMCVCSTCQVDPFIVLVAGLRLQHCITLLHSTWFMNGSHCPFDV